MNSEQRRQNIQSVLDKAKVIMADDRQRLLAAGKIEESFALLARQQHMEQMVIRRMSGETDD
jgi:hypothetical protein